MIAANTTTTSGWVTTLSLECSPTFSRELRQFTTPNCTRTIAERRRPRRVLLTYLPSESVSPHDETI